MVCSASAGPQRLLSTHAANVSSRAEATAGQLGGIENTQRSRCIFRAEPFHLPGAYFCGLSREEVIDRIGSVSVETATILTELFRPVRRTPFGFPFADDERVFFVFAFHLQPSLRQPMYHDWRHCSAIGRHALFIGCGLSFVALLLVAEFIIADAIPRRDVPEADLGM